MVLSGAAKSATASATGRSSNFASMRTVGGSNRMVMVMAVVAQYRQAGMAVGKTPNACSNGMSRRPRMSVEIDMSFSRASVDRCINAFNAHGSPVQERYVHR